MAELAVRGATLHVQRLGEGASDAGGAPPVVFLHGLVMDNLSSWYFSVAPAVASRRAVVLYDLRGHGRSSAPAEGHGLDEHVADLTALLDALAVTGPVELVGNSFGGLLALAFALAHPARVARIALVDALLPEPGWGAAMARTLSLEGPDAEAKIAASFADWLGRHSERKRNRLADQARRLVKQTSLLADLAASRSWEDRELAAVACPVLALYGAESDQRDRGERLARALPDCRLELWPGCTHSILWQETARLRDALVAWTSAPTG